MTPLTLSLACLVLVGVAGNFISFVRDNKILSLISIIPAVYILLYGLYLTFGPIDIYEDATIKRDSPEAIKVTKINIMRLSILSEI